MRILFSLCYVLMIFAIEDAKIGKTQQKTPPDGEKGGEKQYKDYEKNPTLFFLNALASKTDAKISIIFIHGTLLDIFLEIFPIFYPIRVQITLSRPRWSRVHAPAITAWRP